MKLIIAITGASGIIYAKKLLETTKKYEIETHLIITKNAKTVARHEIGEPRQLENLASYNYEPNDLSSPLASGSFETDAMIIVPSSMKTISAIAHGFSSNLVTRAADVHLKERRKLIIVPRETPLNTIHLENMTKLSQMGVVILPAMPAFYHKPKNVEEVTNFIVGKILDQLGLDNKLYNRWGIKLASNI